MNAQEIASLKDRTRISIDLQSRLCATLGVRWELRASFNNFSLTITNDYSLKKIFANCHDPSHLVWKDTGWVPRFLWMLFSCSSPGTEDFYKEWPSKSGSQASVDDVTNCEHRNSDDIPNSEKDGPEDVFDREGVEVGYLCFDLIDLPDDLNCGRDNLDSTILSWSSVAYNGDPDTRLFFGWTQISEASSGVKGEGQDYELIGKPPDWIRKRDLRPCLLDKFRYRL